ncbi:type I restriction-modification system subunit M [Aliifodinibius sp. S!AR15-10]|uniref:type I restriction-modification system subunit M n=1 Tax=Aliifodinibius sp. S!AR15-10 TaxID=2950437 RepID=UPI0028645858|nr:type I restriction-modification system subunit M [Aliifodinibius sp. S!AR15-10]MDR8394461.1 type I restriction-modification system subunit M [Aliifodinibius sp. S!AR15-10]
MSTHKPTQQEINQALWSACDTFRGVVDPAEYKNYILVFLFLKYLSDIWKDHYEKYKEEYGDDEERIKRRMERERFKLPEDCTFDYLVRHQNDEDIGDQINKILQKIEEANYEKLEGVFRNVDFNSEANLGKTKDRNRRLKNLINDFDKPELNFRPSVIGTEDIIGNAYMFLIERFASDAGKKGGEFYTPNQVSKLLAKLLNPQPGDRICDPAIGSGSLAITVAEEVEGRNFRIYGQESNGSTWALCKMNMFLHGMDAADIRWCDTIQRPELTEGDELMKFDIVTANPPFSLKKWGKEDAKDDQYNRFHRGVPPKSRGDYAFIQHMIEVAYEDTGKVGVIVPHGVLFRSGSEGKIRKQLIQENLLEAVIGLPENLFFGTGIPAAIMIFNKGKEHDNVLFIDASEGFEKGTKQNKLRDQDFKKIVETFRDFKEIEKFSYVAMSDEVKENDYNLNIPRYVDTFEPEPEVDISSVQKEIQSLEKELDKVQDQMEKKLEELGFEN